MTNPSRALISVFLRKKSNLAAALYCGKTGIRTLGTRKGTTVFETVPIDHSGIFPLVDGAKLAIVLELIKILT